MSKIIIFTLFIILNILLSIKLVQAQRQDYKFHINNYNQKENWIILNNNTVGTGFRYKTLGIEIYFKDNQKKSDLNINDISLTKSPINQNDIQYLRTIYEDSVGIDFIHFFILNKDKSMISTSVGFALTQKKTIAKNRHTANLYHIIKKKNNIDIGIAAKYHYKISNRLNLIFGYHNIQKFTFGLGFIY